MMARGVQTTRLTLCGGVVAVLLLGVGCADVEFLAYEGGQQNWGTSTGAIVDRRYALPVYHGKPPRPYKVLGSINVEGARGFTQVESATRDAIAEARKRGADAVILVNRGTDSAGATIMPMGYGFVARNQTRGHAQVIAIKWQ